MGLIIDGFPRTALQVCGRGSNRPEASHWEESQRPSKQKQHADGQIDE